jgi:membrane associated rhomboid family serine protease
LEEVTRDGGETLEDEEAGGSAPGRINIATPILLASFLLLYAVMACVSRGWEMSLKDFAMNPFSPGLLLAFGALGGGALAAGEPWRIITAAFVHVNLIHLLFNCWCVFSLGRAVESFYGTRRMFVCFVACTIAANLAAVVASSSDAIQVGTIGGLFGLDGVILGFALRNRKALAPNQFYRTVSSTLFWPVFWIVLAYTVFEGRGNIEGLVAGFAAGAMLGLVLEAVRFRAQPARPKPAPLVNLLFAAAVAACVVSWAMHVGAEVASFSPPDGGRPAAGETPGRSRAPAMHFSKEGGFEVPVPQRMSAREEDGRLEIRAESWAFCIITWRDAEGPEDPYEIAWQVRSHLNQQGFHAEGEITYPEIGREQAAYFAMSRDQQGRRALYAQATLIHAKRVYTIVIQHLADDRPARDSARGIIEGFRFPAGQEH